MQGPSGFLWEYGENEIGASDAEFISSSNLSQGDLYINPIVKYDPDQLTEIPYGSGQHYTDGSISNGSGPNHNGPTGATGALTTLPNDSTLTVTVVYNNGASSVQSTVLVNNLSSVQPEAEPATPAAPVMNDVTVTPDGQDGTTYSGYVHLHVTGLAGRIISSTTLSDQMGFSWSQTDSSLDPHTLLVAESPQLQYADIYFPPARNETASIAKQTSAADMTLTLTFSNDPLGSGTEHVTQFAPGASWNPSLLAAPLNSNSTTVTNGGQLVTAIQSTSPVYDTITLAPGDQFQIWDPVPITHSITIIGNGDSVVFTQGDPSQPSPWPGNDAGAFFAENPQISPISIAFENFSVSFSPSGPLQWYDPNGTTLFNPEIDGSEGLRAVINTQTGNAGSNEDILTLSGMTIIGPPAFEGTPPQDPDGVHKDVGEEAIPLVWTNPNDIGSITGNTLEGGIINVSGGPWTITGNTDEGSVSNTYDPSTFSLHSPHDVNLSSNAVYQTAPNGYIFRLMNIAGGQSYDNTISNNPFVGGFAGNEVTYDPSNDSFPGLNDPEAMSNEPEAWIFEGRLGPASQASTALLSSDGRILTLPVASSSVPTRSYWGANYSEDTIVSILNVTNNDGTINPYAGTWYRVAQQISTSPVTYLMEDPLPVSPDDNYAISVVTGFDSDVYSSNTMNLTGKVSFGLSLDGADFGTTVTGNIIEGGDSYTYPYTGTSILIEAGTWQLSNGDSYSAYPIPNQWGCTPASAPPVTSSETSIEELGGFVVRHR